MKYSFHLHSTGQKKKGIVNWGLPLTLQICPKCEALNHKMATLCAKCNHPLSDPGQPAANSITIAAGTEPGDLAQDRAEVIYGKIPDDLNSASSISAPAAEQAAQNVLIRNRRFIMSNKQKWQRRVWSVVFLAFLATPILVIVISLQPSTAPSYTTKNSDKNSGNNPAIQPPVAPVVNTERAATAPVTVPASAQVLPDTERQTSTPALQGKRATLAPKAKSAGHKIAQAARKSRRKNVEKVAPAALKTPAAPIPQQEKPATPANTRCSEAAHALALCNTN